MEKPEPPKKGCRAKRTTKGITYYVSTTCPAGKQLVKDVTRRVRKELGIK